MLKVNGRGDTARVAVSTGKVEGAGEPSVRRYPGPAQWTLHGFNSAKAKLYVISG